MFHHYFCLPPCPPPPNKAFLGLANMKAGKAFFYSLDKDWDFSPGLQTLEWRGASDMEWRGLSCGFSIAGVGITFSESWNGMCLFHSLHRNTPGDILSWDAIGHS